MNKKAQVFLSIVFFIFYMLAGILILNLVKDDVETARTDLSCSSASTISDGTKLLCLFLDSSVIYLFIVIASGGGGYITERLIR